MENNKLKKLGKYFTKGLQAGVLATALVTGLTGCPNPSSSNGGYEIDDNHGNTGNNGNNNEQGNEWQQPAYYIDEEFGGQVFVDPDKHWSDTTKGQYYTESYTNAQKFMTQKVNELSKMVAGQTDIALYQEIDDALKKMNQGNNIYDNINGNYTALASVFADLENNYIYTEDDKKYNDYKCSYYKLAHHAYNQSLEDQKNVTSISFPGNSEMKNDPSSFFVQQLAYANYDYETLTVGEAKKCMNNTMNDIANNNGVSSDVLKKFVELALYNESLYGLNDLAKFANVNVELCSDSRTANIFDFKINQVIQTQSRSVEDAGMTM